MIRYIHKLFVKNIDTLENTKDTVIIVMGAPRSGTSLLCDLVNGLGIDFGGNDKLVQPADMNPDIGSWPPSI